MEQTSSADFGRFAKSAPRVVISRHLPADTETAVSAYLKLRGTLPSALLESAGADALSRRYCFIVPGSAVRVEQRGDCSVTFENGRVCNREVGPPLEVLRRHLSESNVFVPKGLPPFTGGLVGYLSYSAVRWFEPKVPQRHGPDGAFPDAEWMKADVVAAFDNVRQSLILMAVADVEGARSTGAAYRKARAELDRMQDALGKRTPPREAYAPPQLVEDVWPRADFMRAVARVREYICAGDCMQAVISRRLLARYKGDPFELYRRLRIANPSPYLFHLAFGDRGLVGASPEVMVRVRGRLATVRPIAGTRPRGSTLAQDAQLERELKADPKELAEHVMLLDLGRNDIGRISAPGKVRIDEREVIERYSHVMHMVSQVSGTLSRGEDSLSALASTFPAGTVSGAPKVRAMEIIDELEPVSRGPYAGAAGYLGYGGQLDLAISIRSIAYSGSELRFQAGGGVVYDSVPAREFEETEHKLAGVVSAVGVTGYRGRRMARRG